MTWHGSAVGEVHYWRQRAQEAEAQGERLRETVRELRAALADLLRQARERAATGDKSPGLSGVLRCQCGQLRTLLPVPCRGCGLP